MAKQFTITAVVIKEPQMVGDTILINVPVKEGDVLKINGQTVFLPSTTPDTEWEKEFEKAWKFGVDETQRKANMKFFITNLLTSRDTYWKERVKKEVEEAVDECVKIVNNKVRWAKGADPDEVYEELWAVAGIKEVCEACGERHITNEDKLK